MKPFPLPSCQASDLHLPFIQRLSVQNFRNYEHAVLNIQASQIFLKGPNGAGKTNLLEALSFFAPGRGLRSAKLSEVSRQQERVPSLPSFPSPRWSASIDLVDAEKEEFSLGTGLDYTAEGREKRLLRIQGLPAPSQTDLSQWLSILWVTPQTERLFLDTGSTRRKFLDRLVFAFDPAHLTRLNRYENAMRQRLKILREGPQDPIWLFSLEQQMAQEGVAIALGRQTLLQRLIANQAHFPSFPKFSGHMVGEVETALETRKALEVEELFLDHLKTFRATDRARGRTHFGSHRSDLSILYEKKGFPAESCSTGEQKMLLLAMILAFTYALVDFQAHLKKMMERVRAIVLLLDDVIAHLDAPHQYELLHTLEALKIQTWMTGTDLSSFSFPHQQVFHIHQGQLKESL